MNIFKTKGFDTIIGPTAVVNGTITIRPGETLVIDGIVKGQGFLIDVTDYAGNGDTKAFDKAMAKTTLIVNGEVKVTGEINISNIIVSGHLESDASITADTTLAIKDHGKIVSRDVICYRSLVTESGSVISGRMGHLDHMSSTETV